MITSVMLIAATLSLWVIMQPQANLVTTFDSGNEGWHAVDPKGVTWNSNTTKTGPVTTRPARATGSLLPSQISDN